MNNELLTTSLSEMIPDSHPDGIFVVDPDEKLQYWNHSLGKIFHLNEKSSIGKNFFDVFPQLKQNEGNIFEKVLNGECVITTLNFTPGNKHDHFRENLKIHYSPLRDGDQIIRGILGVVRKQDQNNKDFFKTQENNYRQLVELAPLAIMIHQDGKIVYANSFTAKLLGAQNEDPEELIGMDVIKVVHPDFKKVVKDRMRNVLEQNKPALGIEEKLVGLDGKVINVQVIGLPFMYNGRPAVQVIANDITEWKRSEQLLKRNEELFHQLFANSPLGIVLLDKNHRVLKTNDGFTRIFGYNLTDIYRKKLNNVIVPDVYKNEALNLNLKTSKGEVQYIESLRKNKKGKMVPVIIYGVPVKIKGEIIGIYGIYVDITDRKSAEDKLKIHNKELDALVYKVSHDLRSPLNSITGLLNLMDIKEDNDEYKEFIDLMKERVEVLEKYITDILNNFKSLKKEINVSKVNFEKIIKNSFKELNHLENFDEIEKIIDVRGEAFYSDQWRIEEIFRNLISNSIKYSDTSKNEKFIKINVKVTTSKAGITVEDNGIGIDKKDLPKIYDMFYRATETSRGTGLGLHIVKNSVVLLNGDITINSKKDKGTTIKLSLPNYNNSQ